MLLEAIVSSKRLNSRAVSAWFLPLTKMEKNVDLLELLCVRQFLEACVVMSKEILMVNVSLGLPSKNDGVQWLEHSLSHSVMISSIIPR